MRKNKVIKNAQWIIVCKIVQALIQLVVGMLSARYLGPSNYGLISYASSLVAFFTPVMQLGLQSTLVQEYVGRSEDEGKVLGTSLVMNLVASAACIAGVAAFAAIANRDEPTTILVCVLYSISLMAQSIEMIQYWFQAKLLSKYSSMAMLCGYIMVSAYKIYLLASGKSVCWFALSHTVGFGVTGLLLLATYIRKGTHRLECSMSLAKELFAKSKHYIVAMLMVAIYNSVANILLKLMIGETENGFYATAVSCVSLPGFVFLAIIDTARPVVLESRKISQAAFEKNVSRVYGIIIWLAFGQSVAYTILADPLVRILYGQSYMSSIPVLGILVWQTAFSYMGYIRNIWILGEDKHSVLWIINLSGAVVSILLNMLLIPVWGARGAAAASVGVQFFTNFIMGFILKPIRQNNRLLLKGMDPRLLIEMAKGLKQKQLG